MKKAGECRLFSFRCCLVFLAGTCSKNAGLHRPPPPMPMPGSKPDVSGISGYDRVGDVLLSSTGHHQALGGRSWASKDSPLLPRLSGPISHR